MLNNASPIVDLEFDSTHVQYIPFLNRILFAVKQLINNLLLKDQLNENI